eukprot:41777-Eustigmatos_ZCMA.PRE.1
MGEQKRDQRPVAGDVESLAEPEKSAVVGVRRWWQDTRQQQRKVQCSLYPLTCQRLGDMTTAAVTDCHHLHREKGGERGRKDGLAMFSSDETAQHQGR